MHVSLFLLYSYYIWRVEGFGPVYLYVVIEWEEPKLEEVFYHNSHLDVKK